VKPKMYAIYYEWPSKELLRTDLDLTIVRHQCIPSLRSATVNGSLRRVKQA
jgi:hypothetical protein